MNGSRVTVEVRASDADALASMAVEVREGLTHFPRRIPSKYFYDERGSELFDEITRLPEYYLTRAEQGLLEREAAAIVDLASPVDLIELGPGSARKTRLLLESGIARGTLRRYVPIEVSAETAERSARELAREYPGLSVHTIVGDFERTLEPLPDGGARLVAFLGSTIGNFVPGRAEALVSRIAAALGEDGSFLLGTDLVKDRKRLEAAYNDVRGITAEFNRNVLRVLNARLDGDFDPEAFDHVAFYDEPLARIEMHLASRKEQSVRLRAIDLEVELERGERIRTEVSCKYTRASVEELLAAAGLALERWYEGDGFALSLSRRA